tara:strand:+ start:3062 stop:4174 length:1113 start_codon:yes stop_codon:yes gene_type:complete
MSESFPHLIQIEASDLKRIMDEIFNRLGVKKTERRVIIEYLMEASLSGYHSHGVMRIPMYAAGIQSGNMVPGATIDVVGETASTLHLNANKGMGPWTASKAMKQAVSKSLSTGIGCVSVFNANDIARLGSYVEKPAREGYLTILMVNDAGGNPCVAPWGGTSPLLSTNPLAMGIPRNNGDPILIDISTGVSSEGRVKMLHNKGDKVPDGWLIDSQGESISDPSLYFTSPKKAALLPLGSMIAGHKGFALSILVDVLTGALSGAGCSGLFRHDSDQNALFILAIDPDKFISKSVFSSHVDQLVNNIKGSTKAPGVDEIRVPGDGAYHERERQLKSGIEIDPSVWLSILKLMNELKIKEDYIPPYLEEINLP